MPDIRNVLKTAWLRQLKEDWKTANYIYFKNALHLPNLELSDAVRVLGKWKGGYSRCLSISRVLIQAYPWEYVLEVLYHEMAHQYVEEVLKISHELPHGETFKRVCLEHGIDPTATGEIHSWVEKRKTHAAVSLENNKILGKINKLLALAQSVNPHEAESAMSKAQTLLLKHNLSLLDVETNPRYIHKQIGKVGRRNPIQSIISAILCKFFFVEAIWIFGYDPHQNLSGRILEIYGTPENVEIAAYVQDYLLNTSEQLWRTYKEQEKVSGNKHRRTFIYGLLNGVYHKLDGQVVQHGEKGLVWKGDPRLKAFYRRRNPKRVRTASKYSKSSKDIYRSGVTQGKTLIIHKGIHGKGYDDAKLLN